MESTIKIKNENPQGHALRIQFWNGKLPTYDSEAQRAHALQRKVVGTDEAGKPLYDGNEPATTAETMPDLKKMKKAELAELAKQRGLEVGDDDTVATLTEKLTASYPPAPEEPEAEAEKPAKKGKEAAEVKDYQFKSENMLQEQVLGVGSEKVLTINSDVFVTIKVDK